MKIDFHVHVTPREYSDNWQQVGEKEPYFNLLSSSPKNKFATAEEISNHMREIGFDKAVVFGFGFDDMGRCREVNDYVIEECKKYDNLVGFAIVNPKDPEAAKEVERCAKQGLQGVGEIFPCGQKLDLMSERELAPFAEACVALNMPAIVHTNEPVGHYYHGKTNTTLPELEAFAEHFPQLKMVFAHWGGGIMFYELMKEMREKLGNVYYDNAASIFLYDNSIYRIARELGVLDKVVFGSDYPLLSPGRYAKGLEEESGLNPEEQQRIYVGNALKLMESLGRSL